MQSEARPAVQHVDRARKLVLQVLLERHTDSQLRTTISIEIARTGLG